MTELFIFGMPFHVAIYCPADECLSWIVIYELTAAYTGLRPPGLVYINARACC